VCGRKSKHAIAAPADAVRQFIFDKLHEHYEDAYGNAPFDKETWHCLVETWDLEELISEVMEDAAPDKTVEWIQSTLKDDITYCKRNWQVMSFGSALAAGWERFSNAIKDETRFMFFHDQKDDGGEPFFVRPAEMLDELGDVIPQCGVLTSLKVGTQLFRFAVIGLGRATRQDRCSDLRRRRSLAQRVV
jgi:hypothetical protein